PSVELSPLTPNLVRIIPGPAGIIQQAKLLKEKVFILDSEGALMSTQEYIKKVVDDVGEVEDFNSGAWVNATNYVIANGGTMTGCLGDIDNFLKNGKLEQVVGIFKSCSPNVIVDLTMTIKDISGIIPGIIHYKVIGEGGCGKDITASTLGTLSSNIVPNPKGEMKAVTTRSGLAYEGPSIPTNSPLEKVVEQNTEETTKKEHSNCQRSTAQVQPPVVPIFIPKPDFPRSQPKPTIPYPSRLNDQKLRVYCTNKDKLFELAKVPLNENCSAMLLKKLPKKLGDPELTPTRMTLELADRSITRPKGVAEDVFIKVGKFHFLTDFVVVDFEANPTVPLILGKSFLRSGRALIDVYGEEITLRYNPKSSNLTLVFDPSVYENDVSKEPIVKSSSPTLTPFGEKEPPELELKELPSHLEYAFLEKSDKLLVIIAKDLKDVEKETLFFDHYDDTSFPRPPPEPPDVEFDFEPNSGEVILAVINNNDELNEDNCFDPGGEIDVFKNIKDDDYFPFIFVIRIFLPYFIYPEVSPLLLSAGSEDTIFDPGIFV
nr:hypothetical protein [Tanacetum cinerariifolium]